MDIYVIRKGDTLRKIARFYNVSIDAIAAANGLDRNESLVVGQALLIPMVGSFYVVKEGDSLFKIARMFGIDYPTLAEVNNLKIIDPLKIGTKLFIPPKRKTTIETNAYVEPLTDPPSDELINDVTNITPMLTYLAPFSFRATREGTLIPPPLDDFLEITLANQTNFILTVTNLEEGGFSADLARAILSDATVQDRLINEIITRAKELSAKDVHFDFEFIPGDLKDEYTIFLQKAKNRLQKENILISAALAPKVSSTQVGQWYEAHDYEAIGRIVDFVVLMTYEWGFSGGPPMPVSPLPQVRDVVEYAISVIPKEKIMLGQNLYGYDWTLPFEEGISKARAISPLEAIDIARANNQAIEYSEISEAPYFIYYDNQKDEHMVWFEDPRSINAKFNLIKELGLRGISYWKIGFPFPQNWLLLQDRFDITKR